MNELDAIRARRAAITPGVWHVTPLSRDYGIFSTAHECIAVVDGAEPCRREANAAFIAAAPADVDTLLAMVERASSFEAEVMICHGLLESLTPGGSEFHANPERCAEWARERMASAAKLAKERNELRREVERLTGENANAKAALVAAAALLHQSNAEVERLTGERDAAQQQLADVPTSNIIVLAEAGVRPDDSWLVRDWAYKFFDMQLDLPKQPQA